MVVVVVGTGQKGKKNTRGVSRVYSEDYRC